jgi:hypothetical protein
MMLMEIVRKLGLTSKVDGLADREITGGYASDLLSDVLKNAKSGYIWITNQKHQNCVAVASLLDLSGIIVTGGIDPDPDTLEKAVAEQLPVYTTDQSAFDIAGALYEMGIRGPIQP